MPKRKAKEAAKEPEQPESDESEAETSGETRKDDPMSRASCSTC